MCRSTTSTDQKEAAYTALYLFAFICAAIVEHQIHQLCHEDPDRLRMSGTLAHDLVEILTSSNAVKSPRHKGSGLSVGVDSGIFFCFPSQKYLVSTRPNDTKTVFVIIPKDWHVDRGVSNGPCNEVPLFVWGQTNYSERYKNATGFSITYHSYFCLLEESFASLIPGSKNACCSLQRRVDVAPPITWRSLQRCQTRTGSLGGLRYAWEAFPSCADEA